MTEYSPLVLIILDGWGYRPEVEYNAIANADTPVWNHLWQTYPHTLITGSGEAVGLPHGQMGNSEVGHLHIGAGRLVPQDLVRVDEAVQNGEFFSNHALNDALQFAKKNNSAVHILGLLSPGGVHSHERHIHALIELVASQGISKCYAHAILDGRDTPPRSALSSITALENKMHDNQCGQIASVIGRYYAMDRDKRFERTVVAYDLYTQGIASFHATSAVSALKKAYEREENDEFVQATTIHAQGENPIVIQDNDVVICMNFRADRVRQLSSALLEKNFSGFIRSRWPKIARFVSLTQYATHLPTEIAYPPLQLNNLFGEYIAAKGLTQLRIAETEKYAHVTFFFNGGSEHLYEGEDRILIPSQKVATYDLKPEMSAFELTNALIFAIKSKKYDVIICNFANPDMVGHTGNMPATIKAIEVIDQCLGEIVDALQESDGEAIITADHGNAELMYSKETTQAHTAHTSNLVPFIYIGRPAIIARNNGNLTDIAPTMLNILNLPQPEEMTGNSLIKLK